MKDQGRVQGVSSIVGLAFGAVASLSTASADVIGTSVDNGDGTFTYSYVVDDSSGAFDVAAWSLEFAFANPDWDQASVLDGGDVAVPNDHWFALPGIPSAGLSAQDFLSLDPSGDVLVGTSLGGFSFTSAYAPGLIAFTEFSAAGDSAMGSTVGPMRAIAVPEPCTASLVAIGISMMAAARGRRRRVEEALVEPSPSR